MLKFSASGRNGTWSFAKEKSEVLHLLKSDANLFLFAFYEEGSCTFLVFVLVPSVALGVGPPQATRGIGFSNDFVRF